MPTAIPHPRIYRLYRLGLYLKGLFGVSELSVGLFLYFHTTAELHQIFLTLAQTELLEDPHDPFMHFIQPFLTSFSGDARHFALTFLVLHGGAKLLLIYGLIRNYTWAYPVAIGVFTLFVAQQAYHLTHTFSWSVLVVMLLNLGVTGLIIYEYFYLKKYHHFS